MENEATKILKTSLENKLYRVVKFDKERTRYGVFASWGKAASMLRSLGPGYFIQGPRGAWFYADVCR